MFVIVKEVWASLDCGIVAENIALAATPLGLGNVICGMADIIFKAENGKKLVVGSGRWREATANSG